MIELLRFRDLQASGIVNSWAQLKRLQQFHGFPLGRMLSKNTRAWTREEISGWIRSRPHENLQPLRGSVRIKHERKHGLSGASATREATEPCTAARDGHAEPAKLSATAAAPDRAMPR